MPTLTYASYLDLEKLLNLQKPRSTPPEHDEMLFIIIHQTYELWFKQLLHEFEKIKKDFSAGDLFGAIHSFKRVRTIMKVLVAQVDILETMTPASFSSFRDRLETASGFQSVQFREMEFVLGYKRESTLKYVKPDFPGADRLRERRGRSLVGEARGGRGLRGDDLLGHRYSNAALTSAGIGIAFKRPGSSGRGTAHTRIS